MPRRTRERASVHCSFAWHMMACPAKVDATYLGQAVEELGLELASLVCSHCLRAIEAGYPTREQSA
jgi:hypothetical protein